MLKCKRGRAAILCSKPKCPSQPGRRQSGIALVEFSFGILVLLLLILGTAEIGRIFQSYNTIHKSVRNGARYLSAGALNDFYEVDLSAERIQQATNLILSGKVTGGESLVDGFVAEDITITSELPSGALNPYVRVAVNFDYRPLFSVIPGFTGSEGFDFNLSLVSAVTMRAQR